MDTGQPGCTMNKNIPWEQIEKWMILHDDFPAASKEFNVNEITLRSRARRHSWPLPSVIAKAAAARKCIPAQNRAIIESGVKNLAQRGEEHAKTMFDLAAGELAKVERLPIKNWKDAEIADKAARRSAGMGNDDESLNISIIGLNERMERHDVLEAELVEESVSSPSEPLALPEQTTGS